MLIQRKKAEFPVWGDIFGNILGNDWLTQPENFRETNGTFPAANIKENDHEFLIELAVPGKNKEDFKLDVNENLLTISSEKTVSKEDKEENYTRREYSYSAFRRSFRLPEIANGEETSANYIDGILKISIPKKETKKQGVKSITVS